jgi:type IV secretory pathway TraG/TraD family ATPase VirD4
MSYQPNRRGTGAGSGNVDGWVVGAGALVIAALASVTWAAAALASVFDRAPKPPGNPFTLASDLVHHRFAWTGAATGWAIGLSAVVAVAATAIGVAMWRRVAGGHRIDRAARNSTRDKGLRRYTGRQKTVPGVFAGPGPIIGKVVPGARTEIRATWEDMLVVIAGPRTGKTTCFAIPAIMEAPGAVIVTSNKRDIADATRGLRSEGNRRVWIFDPQGVAGAGASWWWDPLSYVTDVRSARKLAALWSNASKEPDARTDAYFDGAGAELLAELLLAAASAHLPASDVYRWLADSDDDTPVRLLREAGHTMFADGLRGTVNLPYKQKAGVYGVAAKVVSFLSDPRVLEWIEDADGKRPAFSPGDFVESTDTLYSLSREGEGSSGPLVTALTAAVLEAAENKAAASVGGRLAVPLLAVLDEVANVCRWRELPDLYSHYGSRGIVVLSILQSWAQGETCWGEQGMRKLWDAANVKVFAGGSTDTRFLDGLSQLFGHYDRRTRSRSTSGQGSQTSWSHQRERVFSVDDLSALPSGRAAVGLSGTRPVLVQTVPWMDRPDESTVQVSLARYGGPDGHKGEDVISAVAS